jgi:uncharacterized membrane protein YeiH
VAETQGTGLLIFGLQMAATMVCAVGGALAAGRKRLDVVGVVFVSFVAAVGGGSLRDLLLDRNPVFWLAQPSYLTVSLIAGALTWIYICRWKAPVRFLSFVDAFGLGLFTISGIQIAQEMGQSLLICLVMGVITGVAGGLLRDLLCGEIPSIFKSGELYASAALLGGAVFFLAETWGAGPKVCALMGAGTVIGLRLAALHLGWRLPVLKPRN